MNAAQPRNQAFELRDLQDEQEVEEFLRDEENAPVLDHRSHTFLQSLNNKFALSPQSVILLLSLAIVVVLSIYFSIPSTLFIYLASVCFTLPLMLFVDLVQIVHRRRLPATYSQRLFLLLATLTTLYTTFCFIYAAAGKEYINVRGPLPRPIQSVFNPKNETYYIASNLYNSEKILPRYTTTLLQFIEDVGPENVFVSIYENNSKDHTQQMLRAFDKKLEERGVRRKIQTVIKREGFQRLERIERLAHLRNKAMGPIYNDVADGLDGRLFSKVIFINDIIFDAQTIHTLLNTEDGIFDQACAVDYYPVGIYDTCVLC